MKCSPGMIRGQRAKHLIAEYDMADNLSRKYIHGTNRIDERATLIEGSGQQISESPIIYDVDTYYYLLQELDTVTKLITVSGTLAEGYTYDAYGNVPLWEYLPVDFNRDGDVDYDDQDEWFEAVCSTPPTDPVADANSDGTVDSLDWSYLSIYFTGDGEPPRYPAPQTDKSSDYAAASEPPLGAILQSPP